jgi:hypothetical protein
MLFVGYGQRGTTSRPMVSGNPSIIFMFSMA